ncbi:MAG: MFS transporter [Gammaproteobacteria bacterium]|nr:MFS transporter [Gammaproteobacteria bacterium]
MTPRVEEAPRETGAGIPFGPRRLKLRMAPGVSRLNVYTLLFGSFFGIVMMSFVNASQPYLFTEVLHIPAAEQGPLAGHLTFVAEIVVILTIGLIGALSDKIGRKPLYVAAFLLLAIGYFLYPLARSADQLVMFRMFLALGLACNTAMLPSVANDYPVEESRGKMLAVCFMLNGLGLVLVLTPLRLLLGFFDGLTGGEAELTARYWLWTAAGVCLLVSTVLAAGLKPGAPGQLKEREPMLATLRIGVRAGKNIRVALAYAAAVVARGDMAVLSTFFVLWLTQQGIAAGMSTSDASTLALKFYILIQVFALCWLPVLGYMLDRIDRVAGLALAMVLGGSGYFSLFFLDNPLGAQMYLAALLVGMGEISANLASLTLIGSEAPVKGRGAVIGLFSLCGAIGILLVAKVGGTLSGLFGPVAPFVLVASANVTVFVLAVLVLVFAKPPVIGQPESA